MENKRWSLIFIGLCLALAFSVSSVQAQLEDCIACAKCDRDGDGFIKDNRPCINLCDPDGVRIDDNDGDPNMCGGDGDTTTSKRSIDLIMRFDERAGDNIESDGDGPLEDNVDRVGVVANERSQPNPAAGIHMGLNAKPRPMRQLDLNIICEGIPTVYNEDGSIALNGIDKCEQLPEVFDVDGTTSLGYGFSGLFPECEGNQFCNFGTMVRPYKVNCPGGAPCPDVFTMDPSTHLPLPDGMILDPVLMSFRLGFGGAAFLELASAIGADGSQDPGRCLSLHSDPAALAEAVCAAETGTHTSGVNSTDLVDTISGVDFTTLNITVGADIVKNVADGSQGVITGVSATSITAALAGGEHDDWEINDNYTIVRASKCNVSVTAFDEGSETGVGFDDEENDEWEVVADGVTALICIPNTSTLLGKATLTFGFNAKNKE